MKRFTFPRIVEQRCERVKMAEEVSSFSRLTLDLLHPTCSTSLLPEMKAVAVADRPYHPWQQYFMTAVRKQGCGGARDCSMPVLNVAPLAKDKFRRPVPEVALQSSCSWCYTFQLMEEARRRERVPYTNVLIASTVATGIAKHAVHMAQKHVIRRPSHAWPYRRAC